MEAATQIQSTAADGFEAALRAQGRRYHDRHPFHQRMNAGALSREQLRGWTANRFYYQQNLPRKDAAVLANCHHREVRRRWVQRIVDQDGTADGDGGIEAWLSLGKAVGLTRREMEDERHVLPGVRFAVDAYDTFARTRPWTEAVASSLTELFAPELMAERIAAFERHYPWIDRQGLAYFRTRLTQAPRDCEHALRVVKEYCRSPQEREGALAALSFKCDVLWSMLDAIEWAYADR
ncbi:pyrroloquinoline-quinone synthase PqqC [Streptomyces dysideae]|uniref:Pyrroloquinoline-quinone synthase n=1 Tax=Streptomyces dysideae TaxID=909626 RepID=A0A101UYH0_9ACTN|nr:pyrroloquinoline-quinone synthase PqqC [Streptomyces dysideae]KUO19242.1 pyrroloquinoline quinone biosynthesis protein PqqC [Streptomyces dysideae]